MKLSVHLRDRIEHNLRVVTMFNSPGWDALLEDKIEPLEYAAWRDWRTIPAENHAQIIEKQLAGKIGDMMRRWQVEYESQMEADREQLRRIIDLKQEDDVELDLPEEDEVGFVRRWLNKYDAWARRTQGV